LKIVVCVKQVPDSAAKVVVEEGQITWGEAPMVINPWDEYAVEAALQKAKECSGKVVALGLGDSGSTEALKHALAMGCNEALLVSDPVLSGADNLAAAGAMAAAIRKLGDVDMVVFGKQAIDSDTGMMAAQVARLLGWPALTLVSAIPELDTEAKTVRVVRSIEEGKQIVQGKLPVVISVGKDFGEPRYPSFMGIRKAAKAVIPEWGLTDLEMAPPEPLVNWVEVMNPPQLAVKTEMIEGSSAEEIAEKLADKIMAEKVL